MKISISLFFMSILLIISSDCFAVDMNSAKKVIVDASNAVITVLKDKSLDKETKRNKIMDIVNPIFDFELMAKLSLGKLHWPKLDSDQQTQFINLFIKQLKGTYLDKAESFSNEHLKYDNPFTNENKVNIPVNILSKGDEDIKMIYKMHFDKKNEWKIYDLEIQGISIIKSFGSEYKTIIDNESPQSLLKKMENKFNSTKTK